MDIVFAYFDPGSGSLLMQAIVGGTAGLLVFGKYVWNSVSMRDRRTHTNRTESGPEKQVMTADSSGEIPQQLLP